MVETGARRVDPPASGFPHGAASMRELRDRAVLATDVAFSITDPCQAGNPLVWANPAFTRVTGYRLDEVVGHNCRLLQGDATDPAAVAAVGAAISTRQSATVTLLNYRKDGTAFWNQLAISPVFDGPGDLVGFVGIQADVTQRVLADAERERALVAERAAREETERGRARLSVLVDATTKLASTLDVGEAVARLAEISVPALADWVCINLADEHGDLADVALLHRDGRRDLLERYAALQPSSLDERSGVRRLLAGADPFLIHETRPRDLRSDLGTPELVDVLEGLGLRSMMYVPLVARANRVLGTMLLVAGPSGRRFDDDDLEAAADLGRRAGLTIDNARLYQREHRNAELLQRSLLPVLPHIAGVTLAARYLPGESTADVGGDFYDILALSDGSVGFAIGDVVGHDLTAAAAMGHLRGLLRACAWDDADDPSGSQPGRIVDRVDRLVQGLDVAPLATLFFGCLAIGAGDAPARFTYANAGHPYPLLRLPSGDVTRLDGGTGLLLGVSDLGPHRSATVGLPPGSVLVGYTDGLVERRGAHLDTGIDWLAATLAAIPPDAPAEEIADRLVSTVDSGRDDDIAVLVLEVDA